jgi:p-aminobenzoyl-glutamate transporter AbgT
MAIVRCNLDFSDAKAKWLNFLLSASALEVKMSRLRIALVIMGDAILCVVLVLLVQIDQLINSTLYNYGLVFSDNWAQPYWLMLRVSMVLIVVAIFVISLVELPYPIFEENKESEEEPEETAGVVVTEDEVVAEEEGTPVSVGPSE